MNFVSRAALARGFAALVCFAITAHAGGAQARLPQPSPDSGLIGYDDDGLRIHSPDRRRQLKIRGYVTADLRTLLSDTSDGMTNGLAIKRSRLFFDANINPWLAFRLLFDVGPPSSSSPMQDAFVDVGLGGNWWLRAGKQKTPVGLERYMSISAQLLPDRSLASNLHASRDVGVLLTGSFVGEHVDVSVGVFDGAPDGSGSQDSDPNDDKDLTYRVWFKPFKARVDGVEQGFGIAFNGSTGIEKSTLAAGARLPTFKTPAQLTWFNYAEPLGVRAMGRHTRNGVFSYFHRGPFGAMGEWFSNSQIVSRAASVATVGTGGWLASVQYSLTGERSAQEGLLPKTAFDPSKGNWGAWQVGARAARVVIDDHAFPIYADSTVAARGALEVGVGLNWYITRQTKIQVTYEHTAFDGGAKAGNRKPERYVLLRWQAYF